MPEPVIEPVPEPLSVPGAPLSTSVPPPIAGTPVTMEALAAQAQALEGVRRLHVDLADRLAAGEALRGRVDRVSDGLEAVRADQAALRHVVDRDRGRPRGRSVMTLMLVLTLGMTGGVWAWERWADDVPWLKEWRRSAGQAPASRGESLASLVSLGGDHDSIVDALPGAAAAPANGRPRPASAPVWAENRPALTAADVRVLSDRTQRAEELLESARDERNKQLGENARLRQQLIEKQLRLDELMKTIGEVADRTEDRRVLPVPNSRTSDRTPDALVTRVNEALAASGLKHLQLLEVASLEGETLEGLLVRELDPLTGVADNYVMKSARLSVQDGLVSFVLTPEAGEAGDPAQPIAHGLRLWDEAAWIAVGLPVPRGFVPVNVAADALRQLLVYQPYELVSLGGFRDGELRDLVLRHVTSDGDVLRIFSAPRAVVLEGGPELVLRDGVVTEDDIDRPFWHGQSRLPLPGSNYEAWLEVTGD